MHCNSTEIVRTPGVGCKHVCVCVCVCAVCVLCVCVCCERVEAYTVGATLMLT